MARKRDRSSDTWLPLTKARAAEAEIPTGEAFRTEWVDFERGIRMGNLEPPERITQIVKYHLENRYGQPFVCDRWGRGVFWRWICWVSRANREAKPISNKANWSCAKFFISVDFDERAFECGLQVERGPAAGPERFPGCRLGPDWDWHRLVHELRPNTRLDRRMRRLLREDGFSAWIGSHTSSGLFTAENYTSARQLREALDGVSDYDWAGFQLYYPFAEDELRGMSGHELVEAMFAVFAETVPAMNLVSDVPLPISPDAPKTATRTTDAARRRKQ